MELIAASDQALRGVRAEQVALVLVLRKTEDILSIVIAVVVGVFKHIAVSSSYKFKKHNPY